MEHKTNIAMTVLQVSTREFRDRQASLLDLADHGEHIIIRRGNKAYAITPINAEELYFTPEILAKIDRSLRQAKEGKVRRFGSVAELEEYIGEGWGNEMPPEAEREACGGRRQPAGVQGGGQPTITMR